MNIKELDERFGRLQFVRGVVIPVEEVGQLRVVNYAFINGMEPHLPVTQFAIFVKAFLRLSLTKEEAKNDPEIGRKLYEKFVQYLGDEREIVGTKVGHRWDIRGRSVGDVLCKLLKLGHLEKQIDRKREREIESPYIPQEPLTSIEPRKTGIKPPSLTDPKNEKTYIKQPTYPAADDAAPLESSQTTQLVHPKIRAALPKKYQQVCEEAAKVVKYFTEITGKRAGVIQSNLEPICRTLLMVKNEKGELFTAEDCRLIIEDKYLQWKDPRNEFHSYISIDTFFRETKVQKNYENAIAENSMVNELEKAAVREREAQERIRQALEKRNEEGREENGAQQLEQSTVDAGAARLDGGAGGEPDFGFTVL